MKYQTPRHKRLMKESELALLDAASSRSEHTARVAVQVLENSKMQRLWECRHAQWLLPVAQQRKRSKQILQLRKLETELLHQRSLVNFIRTHGILGAQRDALLQVFYGARDPLNAVLIEHRNYLLAESSHVSTDHLIGLMHDQPSEKLLRQYANAYRVYFSLYCFIACARDSAMASAVKVAMSDADRRVRQIRRQLQTEPADRGYADFDREALLAESGRHRAINYMNR